VGTNEDRRVDLFLVPLGKRSLFVDAVFDGHAGPEAADWLRDNLMPHLQQTAAVRADEADVRRF
jgi:hypothetical protein